MILVMIGAYLVTEANKKAAHVDTKVRYSNSIS